MTECELADGVSVQLDLDGDGTLEMIEWKSVPFEYDSAVMLRINGRTVWSADNLWDAHVYAADLDSDGSIEVLVTGDEMSFDFITACLSWQDGEATLIPFESVWRGDFGETEMECGYGLITAIGENTLELMGAQDVLGTYFGTRTFALQDGKMMLADDGLWRFAWDLSDAELWEYNALTAVQEIPAVFFADGVESDGVLAAGEKIVITASDCDSVALFITQDGREGKLTIARDEENGWGHTINGRSEAELFEYLPYAG